MKNQSLLKTVPFTLTTKTTLALKFKQHGENLVMVSVFVFFEAATIYFWIHRLVRRLSKSARTHSMSGAAANADACIQRLRECVAGESFDLNGDIVEQLGQVLNGNSEFTKSLWPQYEKPSWLKRHFFPSKLRVSLGDVQIPRILREEKEMINEALLTPEGRLALAEIMEKTMR